jgi:hypothetical protein
MTRYFNTAGPNDPARHYTVPVLGRLPSARRLVEQGQWFVVHAPRQSGKTTAMKALAADLTASGRFAAVKATCESAAVYSGRPELAEVVVADAIRLAAETSLPEALRPPPPPAGNYAAGTVITRTLSSWAAVCPRPIVLLLDEVDALQDDALSSLLRQLRSGFDLRPSAFPSSIALIGLRDVRDYKVASGGSQQLGTSSPFNVSVDSLTLRNFSEAEVISLYADYTAETGQGVEPEATVRVWHYTRGQPWLVSALARQLTEQAPVPSDRSITAVDVDLAKERLVLARATHLDSLAARLAEPRVRRVIGPILASDRIDSDVPRDDLDYCRDLGLIDLDSQPPAIANPIYAEVIPRDLSSVLQDVLHVPRRTWSTAAGSLDTSAILAALADFWRSEAAPLMREVAYREAAFQLVVQAFLQRVVNGGGLVEREYALGTGRCDLFVRWPVAGGFEKHLWELKVWREGRPDPVTSGLLQVADYLSHSAFASAALLVFDDRRQAKSRAWVERVSASEEVVGGARVTVLRL